MKVIYNITNYVSVFLSATYLAVDMLVKWPQYALTYFL